MNRWIVLFFLWIGGIASAGTLVTRDGQTLTGDLSLSESRITVTPAEGAAARSFALKDVMQATFAQPAAAPAAAYAKRRRDKTPTGPVKVFVEYFADTDFKDRRLARFESAINTAWDRKMPPEAG